MMVIVPSLTTSQPLIDEMMSAVSGVAPALRAMVPADLGEALVANADLLQTVVSGGTTTTGTVTDGGGAVTAVTTLPAPVTTVTTMPAMMTVAPGIAIGILKALLIGKSRARF